MSSGTARVRLVAWPGISRFSVIVLPAYAAAIVAAEMVTALVDARWGVGFHVIVLWALLLHFSSARESSEAKVLLALCLAPLIRILSLAMPLEDVDIVYWFLIVNAPVIVAAVLVARTLGLTRYNLGLTVSDIPLQLLVGVTGVGLGVVEYLILKPDALVDGLIWQQAWLAALILLVATGFGEELVFRGVMQSASAEALGKMAILWVAAVFAALHVGYKSVPDVAFAFSVGLFFGWVVARTRCLLGVGLCHGVLNVMLYVIAPFTVLSSVDLGADLARMWTDWGMAGLALVALGVALLGTSYLLAVAARGVARKGAAVIRAGWRTAGLALAALGAALLGASHVLAVGVRDAARRGVAVIGTGWRTAGLALAAALLGASHVLAVAARSGARRGVAVIRTGWRTAGLALAALGAALLGASHVLAVGVRDAARRGVAVIGAGWGTAGLALAALGAALLGASHLLAVGVRGGARRGVTVIRTGWRTVGLALAALGAALLGASHLLAVGVRDAARRGVAVIGTGWRTAGLALAALGAALLGASHLLAVGVRGGARRGVTVIRAGWAMVGLTLAALGAALLGASHLLAVAARSGTRRGVAVIGAGWAMAGLALAAVGAGLLGASHMLAVGVRGGARRGVTVIRAGWAMVGLTLAALGAALLGASHVLAVGVRDAARKGVAVIGAALGRLPRPLPGPLTFQVSGIAGLQGLFDLNRDLNRTPAVGSTTVRSYYNGEATISVALSAAVRADELVANWSRLAAINMFVSSEDQGASVVGVKVRPEPSVGPLTLQLSGISDFQGLLDLNQALNRTPAVGSTTVRSYYDGEATIAVSLSAAVRAEELVANWSRLAAVTMSLSSEDQGASVVGVKVRPEPFAT